MASDFEKLINDLAKELKADFSSGNKETKELFSSVVDKNEMKAIANRLKKYVEDNIQYYFDNYNAASANGWDWTYKGESFHYGGRTGQFLDSVLVDVNSTKSGLSAKVYFDDSKVWRDSLFGSGYDKAYLPSILNDGFRVKSGWHKDIHHFGYFEGARFIEAAIMEAKQDPMFDGVDIIYEPSGNYGMNF